MADRSDAKPPSPFKDWRECRDYYALESIFLMQLADRQPSRRNQKRAKEASEKAFAAEKRRLEETKLQTRQHHGSWWVYDPTHDSDTGPYATQQEARAWIDGIRKEEPDNG